MNRIFRRLVPAFLLVAAWAFSVDRAQAQITPASVGGGTFISDTGRAVRLSDYRGKVVFVNFWGSWCTPCLQEMQSIRALQASLGAYRNNIAFIFVSNRPGDLQKDSAWLRAHGVTGESVRMEGAGTASVSVPTTYVLDPSGAVAQYRSEAVDWQIHAEFIRGLAAHRTL